MEPRQYGVLAQLLLPRRSGQAPDAPRGIAARFAPGAAQARTPGRAQGAQGLPGHGVLGGRPGDRGRRARPRQGGVSGFAHHLAGHRARRHARYQGGQRHPQDHRAQEPDSAPGGAALLRAGRRGGDLGHRPQLPGERQDGARVAGCRGAGRAGGHDHGCADPQPRRGPGGLARARAAGPQRDDHGQGAHRRGIRRAGTGAPGERAGREAGADARRDRSPAGARRLSTWLSPPRWSPARARSPSAFRLPSPGRCSARSITSPRSPMAAWSRPCPASCPTSPWRRRCATWA